MLAKNSNKAGAPSGPLSDLSLSSHEALMMRQHSTSMLQSIESR